MAKVKLVRFELLTLLSESKKVMEFLQREGIAELKDIDDERLIRYKTDEIVERFLRNSEKAEKAFRVLEAFCNIRTPFLQSFSDTRQVEYSEYRLIGDKSDELLNFCGEIIALQKKIEELNCEIVFEKQRADYFVPWLPLDIPMGSKRTLSTSIFIGTFKKYFTKEKLIETLLNTDNSLTDTEVEIIHAEKFLTCAVIMCHNSHAERMKSVLEQTGFITPDKLPSKTAEKAKKESEERIEELKDKINDLTSEIDNYKERYDEIRFLYDYYLAQADKYRFVEKTGATEYAFFLSGYMPERVSDEIKFETERRFTAQMDLYKPDYETEDVPVLIENNAFAGGVEAITDMYSPPSNKDIDPNPVMSVFYYLFFGMMLSDAGYGMLMVLFALFAKLKLKVKGSFAKSVNMALFCGISSIVWGALFGGFFGDLVGVVCTEFLGFAQAPKLALWLEPMNDTMELLKYSLIFGIVHLFAGLALRFVRLIKEKNYISAFFDVIPVVIFVSGFAITGGSFLFTVSETIKPWGVWLLAIGIALIVMTAGRDAKNILGKLGSGLYALYNTASGYLGDILSYSRLLALCLVTGVIANVINLLAAMTGNIIIFVLIEIIGHAINIAINLIGTYVHTNRLQYVEFFTKFYEGSGKTFTPLKINSKFFTIREDKKYE